MRKTKLFIFSVLTVLTVSLFAGCSNGKETESTPESAETEQGTESKEDAEEDDDLSAMYQNLNTVDMNGEKVTSEIFSDKKLTLVNIWATWCGPCVGEIPELEELSKEYEDKGVGIKGLLVQVDMTTGNLLEGLTDDERATAEDILSNVTYQQILVSKDMKAKLGIIQGFPTSYFVDKNGKVVGEPIVGANNKDDWKKIIDERLKMLETK